MKKKLAIIFILILTLKFGFAQVTYNTDRYNDGNVYYQALKEYLYFRASDSYYAKLKQIDTLYIYKDSKTTDSLLDKIGVTKIIMIEDPYTFIKNQNGQGITLYSIFPLNYENGEFSVSFVPFVVTIDKRKRSIMYSNPGSYKVVFKYNGSQFIFIRIEDHGI